MKILESVLDFPKETLCEDIWMLAVDQSGQQESWQLLPEVEQRIIDIVQQTCNEAKIGFDQTYVYITGSITSNTYTANADIDVHIHLNVRIRETEDMTHNRFKNAFQTVKEQHEEGYTSIAGHPIELYYQPNQFQDFMSVGCYELLTRKWLVGPEFKDQSYNPYSELYKDIQSKASTIIKKIRSKVLDVYEKAVVLTKVWNENDVQIAQQSKNDMIKSLNSAVQLFESAREMRKVYSSPKSLEQALQYRASKKWKVADATFKLMDKFGYLAILKKYSQLAENTEAVEPDQIAVEVLKTVKKYLYNEEKLSDSEELDEAEEHLAMKMKQLIESWQPDFDDKPVNQWGEKWQRLKPNDWLFAIVNDAAKDCQIDPYEDGPRLERLHINSVHLLNNGNLIVTVFGGANGGGMQGGCNLKYYLCLIRKMLGNLVGCCKPFADAWLIDWDNDCADDVWTLRFVLQPTTETEAEMAECGYSIFQVNESVEEDECLKYVNKFKDKLGYRDDYYPKHSIDEVEMWIARECALRQPYDTAARETEGDAVILLVMSRDEEAVKAGKKLGNFMMSNGHSDDEKLLKLMSDAYIQLCHLEQKRKELRDEKLEKSIEVQEPENEQDPSSEDNMNESIKSALSLATIVGLLAIPNILPKSALAAELKGKDLSHMTVNSPQIRKAIKNATSGRSYNGLHVTNIVNAVSRTIYAEGKGETKEGIDAIASVIWNRAGGKCERLIPVISKNAQFSCWASYTKGWTDQTYMFKIPADTFNNSDNKATWDYCMGLAVQLVNEEFTSTIGNRNSYMNKAKANAKAKREWGDKLDLKIGHHEFGYLKNNDGFRTKTPTKAKPVYIVKAGDTLEKIAKAHNTTVDEIQKKNKIKDRNKISIGQRILV